MRGVERCVVGTRCSLPREVALEELASGGELLAAFVESAHDGIAINLPSLRAAATNGLSPCNAAASATGNA
jgi:hypothetical protein